MAGMLPVSEVWQIILIFLLGSSIFSFLNVVIYRVPLHMDIVKAPSRCEVCGHTLSLPDMFPVFGWFLLRGRCRYCKAAIPARYPAVEALGGCISLLCVYRWGISVQALVVFGFLAVLTVTAFVDIDTMKIPNGFVLAAGVVGVLSIPFFPIPDLTERMIGVCSVSVILLVFALILPGGFGGGDIKLTAACGLFLGWKQSLTAFVLAVLLAGCYCILMLAAGKLERRSKFAFGAFLCLGMAVALFI